ncbi:MAG TPA: saccharopine dehydrogenase NADP-binding domain-containing protein, partial [Anaeromyxobacteraceae bacterium]|nr:saccharopine dehydrogenase NADP-binding domain-containing protein [Anaeromyxobacteraceae bacterium]
MPAAGMIYGAYGYTGELVARRSVARGLRPVLAGRREAPLRALATELGLEARAFALDDPAAAARALAGVGALLHCAGPFAHTWRSMVDACLEARCHYLDVTGEVDVFERMAALSSRAEAAGVMLLPGVGFDVVPSDALAAHVAARLPGATRLRLAFTALGGVSRGTALTMVERLGSKGLVRCGGSLVAVRPFRRATLDLGDGRPRPAVQIPWGDLATAWRSTGIPDLEVYMVVPRAVARSLSLAALAGPLLGLPPLRRALA